MRTKSNQLGKTKLEAEKAELAHKLENDWNRIVIDRIHRTICRESQRLGDRKTQKRMKMQARERKNSCFFL